VRKLVKEDGFAGLGSEEEIGLEELAGVEDEMGDMPVAELQASDGAEEEVITYKSGSRSRNAGNQTRGFSTSTRRPVSSGQSLPNFPSLLLSA
jgi:hypothetical protein